MKNGWDDVVYAEHDGVPLLARVYRARRGDDAGASVVVDIHGGAWNRGDRTQGALYASHLARSGYVVVSIDFRQGPQHRHPAASHDIAAAMSWVGSSAAGLGADAARVALIGSSSGGHLALLGACLPSTFTDSRLPPVACVAALWPPVDPLRRYQFAIEQAATQSDERIRGLYERLRQCGDAYFGDESAMASASIPRLVRAGEAEHLPPVYVARAGRDTNVPAEMIDDLADAWRGAGGTITISEFADQHHGFGHRPSDATDRFLSEITDFLDRHT